MTNEWKWIETKVYKSESNKNYIWIGDKCSDCKKSYNQKWVPATNNCDTCRITKDLEKEKEQRELKIKELENNLSKEKEALSEKDLIIENLKQKLAEIEIKEENKEIIQSEIIENNEDNHSDSNYSLVEES